MTQEKEKVPEPMPAPMKQQAAPIHSFRYLSRKTMKESLKDITQETLVDLIRVKRPQRPTLVIGQIFAIMLWIFREQKPFFTQSNYINSSKVPYQNLEAQFEIWENIQEFIGEDLPGLLNEVRGFINKIPLSSSIVESHLSRLQTKVLVNNKTILRCPS